MQIGFYLLLILLSSASVASETVSQMDEGQQE